MAAGYAYLFIGTTANEYVSESVSGCQIIMSIKKAADLAAFFMKRSGEESSAHVSLRLIIISAVAINALVFFVYGCVCLFENR